MRPVETINEVRRDEMNCGADEAWLQIGKSGEIELKNPAPNEITSLMT